MAERITCPDCRSVLKPAKPVPDGKKVKCPKCGNTFTTPGLVEEEDRPSNKSTGKAKGKVAVKKAAPPRSEPSKEPDDDDDGGGIYGYVKDEEKPDEEKPQIEYAPDMSIKDLRGPAQAALVRPSNYLLLVGGLSALSNIFMICYSFWPMVFTESPVNWRKVVQDYYKGKQDKGNVEKFNDPKLERKDLKDKEDEIVSEKEDEARIERFSAMGGFIFLLLYNGIAVFGAVKMQNMESRGWGIASSIMTLLPMSAAGLSSLLWLIFSFFLGMIFDEESMRNLYGGIAGGSFYLLALLVGVWSLRTLMSEEVIAGFEYKAE